MPNVKKKGYSASDLRDVSDNPEWTRKDFAKARPFAEVLPDLAKSIRKGRGPNKAPTKNWFLSGCPDKCLMRTKPRDRAGSR
jgi:hypothetical protein